MAKASVTYRWATGECLVIEVKADDGYPDELSELEHRVLSTLKGVWEFMPDAEG